MKNELQPDKPVIVFDGVCNLCNSVIDFVIRYDIQKIFLFAPSQGAYGKQLLKKTGIKNTAAESIVLTDHDRIYKKSTAALKIFKRLPFPVNLLYFFIIFPPWIRDPVYDFIARNRYKWFGKKPDCRLPAPSEMDRFIM
jgi:predicted DCC family thiol-disulfide oxidoreductase YuxK